MKHMIFQFLTKVFVLAGYVSLLVLAARSDEPIQEDDRIPIISVPYEQQRTLN